MVMSENTMSTDRSKKPSPVLLIIIGIGAMGLLLFFVVHSIQKRRSVAEAARLASAPHIVAVRVVKPSLAPDTVIILLPGTVLGHRETFLYARVNGYIRNWYVDIGDPVKEGQL
jgi:multidrug efflux pump subunit AcrA (membrane-fusion protein)